MRFTNFKRLCGAVSLSLVLAACSSVPGPRLETGSFQSEAVSAPAYLHGVTTAYSTPLTDLGDAELLGPDSAMKDALVGGGAELLVAAAVFEQDDVFTLDLILLNQGQETVHVAREDLFVVDAEGVWLAPMADWDAGKQYGLRARQAESAADVAAHLPYYEMDYGSQALAYRAPQTFEMDMAGDKRIPSSAQPVERPMRYKRDFMYRASDFSDPAPTRRAVEVPAESGRAFWGYFEAGQVAFPLTAVVLVDGEQLLFRFDR